MYHNRQAIMGSSCCMLGSKTPSAPQAQYSVKYNSQEAIINEEVMITDEPLTCIDSQDAKKLMHKSICAITYFIESKGNIKCCHGSGILISRNIILTAAHNIFLREYRLQGKKTCYKIYLAVSGVGQHFYQVEDWRYSKDFPSCQLSLKAQFDYCIIKLKTNVPQDKFLPVSLPCKCILQKRSELVLKVFGFPTNGNYQVIGQSNPKIVLNQYGMSKKDAISQIQLQKYAIKYNIINTLGGQSGCPLVIDDKVIGIHIGAINIKGKKSNVGRIITDNLLNDVDKWVKQVKGDAITIIRKPSCSICLQPIPEKPKEEKHSFKQKQYQPMPIVNWKQIKQEGNFFKLTDSKKGKKFLPKIHKNQQIKKKTLEEQLKQIQQIMQKGMFQFIKQRFEDSANTYHQCIKFYQQQCAKDSKELRNRYIRSISQLGSCYIMMKRYNDGLQFFTQLKNSSGSYQKVIEDWLVILRKNVNK